MYEQLDVHLNAWLVVWLDVRLDLESVVQLHVSNEASLSSPSIVSDLPVRKYLTQTVDL